MIRERLVKKVYVITPGSLRKSWLDEYCLKCGADKKYLVNNFIFITYNYMVAKKVEKEDFNDSLVIIDEVHNLVNSIKNDLGNQDEAKAKGGKKNITFKKKSATVIYNKIINSACRVLVLSGTPAREIYREWPILETMLKGKGNGVPTKESLKGVISYFPGSEGFYPTVYYKDPIKVEMSNKQWEYYDGTKYSEEKFRAQKPKREKFKTQESYEEAMKQWIVASKWIRTRGISNCLRYPLFLGKTAQEMKENGEKVLSDDLTIGGGWIGKEMLKEYSLLRVISPKFTALIFNIVNQIDTKHFVFSFFKTRGGVIMIKSLLALCGISSTIYSGDIDDEDRQRILRKFNSPENRNGEKIKVLLATDAGGEGINILEVNNVHIIESSTNEEKTRQAIGRCIRFKSHIHLPEDRRSVNVWRYWSTPPGGGGPPGIDEELYWQGVEKKKKIDEFNQLLIDNSIEADVRSQSSESRSKSKSESGSKSEKSKSESKEKEVQKKEEKEFKIESDSESLPEEPNLD
jgi:superfamily II DNA or RNA helicase